MNDSKILPLSQSILISNLRRNARPFKLTYAITYKCNSRCVLCNIWKKKNHSELSDEEKSQFFEKNRYFQWIDITGGEVFLVRNLPSIVETIVKTQENLYLLHMPTNGIMTKKIVTDVSKILTLKPKKFIISISLDGPPDLHDKLRGIPSNWEYATRTYKELKAFSSDTFDCYFGMTVSGKNYLYIEETYQMLRKIIPKIDRHALHFNIAHTSAHYYGNQDTDLQMNKDIPRAIQSFVSKKNLKLTGISTIEWIYQKQIQKYLESGKTPIPCKAFSSSLFLDPGGNIYPCSIWNNSIGNIRDIDFELEKIWQSNKILETVRLIREKKCPNCWTPCEAYQSILGNLPASMASSLR